MPTRIQPWGSLYHLEFPSCSQGSRQPAPTEDLQVHNARGDAW
ncbi:hypothetical protein RSAG8_01226, partial [Rhizoctonia solani AG-8 WAC10335]